MEQEEFFRAVQFNYPVDLGAAADLVRRKYRDQFQLVLSTADSAAEGRFALGTRGDLEQAVAFPGEIDWLFQPGEDPEFVYAFNRMRFWISMGQAYQATGEEKYPRAFARQLCGWVDTVKREDPACAKAWRTVEAGVRMEVWSKAIGYFKGSPALTGDVIDHYLSSMKDHAEYIMSAWDPYHLMSSWGVMANHGLFAAGCVLPQSGRTAEYQKEAARRLWQELQMQVDGDGMQWEQSPMYHNAVLRCFLDVVLHARRAGYALPKGFEEAVYRMARVSMAWQKPDGCAPMMGDSDQVDQRDLMTLAAALYHDSELKFAGYPRLDYDTLWELGPADAASYGEMTACCPERGDQALMDSGNFFFRSGWGEDGVWARFHCGMLGADHGHGDQLHFDVTAFGQDILTDLGRFTYVDGPGRREFKNPSGHNTVVVDGEDFYVYKDSWECSKLSRAVNQRFYAGERYGYAEGGHLGYYEKGVFVNRRFIYLKPDVFLIADEFYSSGSHSYRQFFHWAEGGGVRLEDGAACWQGESAGACLRQVSAWPLTARLRPGRVSRHYNAARESTVLETFCSGEGFVSVFTVISVDRGGTVRPVAVEKLPVYSNLRGTAFSDRQIEALRITKARRSWVVAVAHEEYASPTDTFRTGGCTGFGGVVAFGDGETEIGTVLAR